MTDYLMRDQAPLTDMEWQRIDKTTVEIARQILVSRRFTPLFGPLGPGFQTILVPRLTGVDGAVIDPTGEADVNPVRPQSRAVLMIPVIYKDFILSWRDIETSRAMNLPLEVAAAAAAANFVAFKEDELILKGDTQLGIPGLMNADGRNSVTRGDWGKGGTGLAAVVGAIEKLVSVGQFGPYAVVLSPGLFAALERVLPSTGVLEIQQVRDLAAAGVFQTPALAGGEGLVLSVGPQNFDLVVSQDLTTAYLGPEKMDHLLRVMESLVLRIKRGNSVVTLD